MHLQSIVPSIKALRMQPGLKCPSFAKRTLCACGERQSAHQRREQMLPPEGRGQKNAMYVVNQKQQGAVRALCAMKFRGSSNTGGFVKHFGHHPERTRKPLEASFLWCSKGCYIVKDESKEVLSTYRELGWRPHL